MLSLSPHQLPIIEVIDDNVAFEWQGWSLVCLLSFKKQKYFLGKNYVKKSVEDLRKQSTTNLISRENSKHRTKRHSQWFLEEVWRLEVFGVNEKPFHFRGIFLEFILKGLQEDIKHIVKMMDPYILCQAINKARYQEKVIEVTIKKER